MCPSRGRDRKEKKISDKQERYMAANDRTGGLPESRTLEDVAQYIKKMRFRKKLFGGLDEADVWRQIELLNHEYEAVFIAQEIKHQEELERAGAIRSAEKV